MKCYTVEKGRINQGIFVEEQKIRVGEDGRNRKLVVVPIPRNAFIENDRCMSVPAKPEFEGAVMIYIKDHSGFRGNWSMDADPNAIVIIAEGRCADGIAGRMGGGPEYLLILKNKCSIEISRSGRLYGAPSLYRVENDNGELKIIDVAAEASEKVALQSLSAIIEDTKQ